MWQKYQICNTNTRQHRVQRNESNHSCLARHEHWINLDGQILPGCSIAAENLLRKIRSPSWIFRATISKGNIHTNSHLLLQPQMLSSRWNKLLLVSRIYCVTFIGDLFFSILPQLAKDHCFSTLAVIRIS